VKRHHYNHLIISGLNQLTVENPRIHGTICLSDLIGVTVDEKASDPTLDAVVAAYRPIIAVGGNPANNAMCRIAFEEYMAAHPGADVHEADAMIRELAA
jgi:hypothetical protein